MSETPNRYPLAWPAGRPRRPARDRQRGDFSMTPSPRAKARRVNIEAACNRLEDQIGRLGGVYAILSSNVELRMDGRPRMDRAAPADPGCCVYFQLKGEPYAMACDTYDEVAQNIAALAAHIEATRRIERYGVASAAETLRAFAALPPPPSAPGAIPLPPPRPARDWWEVFGVIRETCDEATVGAIYRTKAKAPGVDLVELNLARDAAVAEIRGRK